MVERTMNYNAELIIHKMMVEHRATEVVITSLEDVIDKLNPPDAIIKAELSLQVDVLKAKAKSLTKQIFDIRKNMV